MSRKSRSLSFPFSKKLTWVGHLNIILAPAGWNLKEVIFKGSNTRLGGGGGGSCKVTKNWKKLKEDRKIITEIISLAFFQNENFSNIAAK